MDKEVVVHVHNGILLSCKKEHVQVSSNEVDKPKAYYTEWSQKEKDKYHILIYMEYRKIVLMILFVGQQEWHKEQTFGHSGRRKGWDDLRE